MLFLISLNFNLIKLFMVVVKFFGKEEMKLVN